MSLHVEVDDLPLNHQGGLCVVTTSTSPYSSLTSTVFFSPSIIIDIDYLSALLLVLSVPELSLLFLWGDRGDC